MGETVKTCWLSPLGQLGGRGRLGARKTVETRWLRLLGQLRGLGRLEAGETNPVYPLSSHLTATDLYPIGRPTPAYTLVLPSCPLADLVPLVALGILGDDKKPPIPLYNSRVGELSKVPY